VVKIVGIAGSLRQGSLNRALLEASIRVAPAGTHVVIGSIHGIPLYDGDMEASQGIPAAVTALKTQILDGDALMLVTPEYNGSMPGVLKNAIDWLSRPPSDIPRLFHNRPIALLGATPGRSGTILAQTAWLPVLRTLGMRPFFAKAFLLGGAGELVSAAGGLTDPKTLERLRDFVTSFTEFIGGTAER
jgi:NAD(P)H-dependent FMN reductase